MTKSKNICFSNSLDIIYYIYKMYILNLHCKNYYNKKCK